MATKEVTAFLQLLDEYASYLEETGRMEAQKRDALLSNQLEKIQRTLQQQQAVVMQLGNLEKRRAELQQACGFGGLSFRQILAKLPEEEQPHAEAILKRFEAAVQEIRFNNDKAMDIAQDKIKIISQIIPEEISEGEAYAPPSVKAAKPAVKMLEKKI